MGMNPLGFVDEEQMKTLAEEMDRLAEEMDRLEEEYSKVPENRRIIGRGPNAIREHMMNKAVEEGKYIVTPFEISELRSLSNNPSILTCRKALEVTYGYQDLALRFLTDAGTYREHDILREAEERRIRHVPCVDLIFNHRLSSASSLFICMSTARARECVSWSLIEGTKNLNYALCGLRDPCMANFVRSCYDLFCEEFKRIIREDFPLESEHYIQIHHTILGRRP